MDRQESQTLAQYLIQTRQFFIVPLQLNDAPLAFHQLFRGVRLGSRANALVIGIGERVFQIRNLRAKPRHLGVTCRLVIGLRLCIWHFESRLALRAGSHSLAQK